MLRDDAIKIMRALKSKGNDSVSLEDTNFESATREVTLQVSHSIQHDTQNEYISLINLANKVKEKTLNVAKKDVLDTNKKNYTFILQVTNLALKNPQDIEFLNEFINYLHQFEFLKDIPALLDNTYFELATAQLIFRLNDLQASSMLLPRLDSSFIKNIDSLKKEYPQYGDLLEIIQAIYEAIESHKDRVDATKKEKQIDTHLLNIMVWVTEHLFNEKRLDNTVLMYYANYLLNFSFLEGEAQALTEYSNEILPGTEQSIRKSSILSPEKPNIFVEPFASYPPPQISADPAGSNPPCQRPPSGPYALETRIIDAAAARDSVKRLKASRAASCTFFTDPRKEPLRAGLGYGAMIIGFGFVVGGLLLAGTTMPLVTALAIVGGLVLLILGLRLQINICDSHLDTSSTAPSHCRIK